ncbi:hypothetical protein ACFQ0M_32980 [Kitasatospora aburaviensis]
MIGTGTPALTVEGPVRALLAWLSGRSDGDGLRRAPDAALPQLPRWADRARMIPGPTERGADG